jgi:hypothetical protein
MNRKERRKAKLKGKRFELAVTDIPNMVDAMFRGTGDGWVTIAANAKGRQCVEQVFPDAHIAWRAPGDGFPGDWQGFDMNLPDTASATRHNLPPINGSTPLDEATPDAVAFVLAFAAKNQGARSMLLKEDGSADLYVGKES